MSMRMFGGHSIVPMRMLDGRIRTTKSFVLYECLMVSFELRKRLMLRNLNINIQITNTIFILKPSIICIINKT